MKQLLHIILAVTFLKLVISEISWNSNALGIEKSGLFLGDSGSSTCRGSASLCYNNQSLGYYWMATTENDYDSNYCSSGYMVYCNNVGSIWTNYYWSGTAPFCSGGCSDCTNTGAVCIAYGDSGDGEYCYSGYKVLCVRRYFTTTTTTTTTWRPLNDSNSNSTKTFKSNVVLELGLLMSSKNENSTQEEQLEEILNDNLWKILNLNANNYMIKVKIIVFNYISSVKSYGINLKLYVSQVKHMGNQYYIYDTLQFMKSREFEILLDSKINNYFSTQTQEKLFNITVVESSLISF